MLAIAQYREDWAVKPSSGNWSDVSAAYWKRRSQNFSDEEMNILLAEVEARRNRILGGGKRKPPMKVQSIAWKEVATVVSANSTVRPSEDQCRKKLHTLMRAARLTHNARERSLSGGEVPYIKELTEQEEFTRQLLGLSDATNTSGAADMGMNDGAVINSVLKSSRENYVMKQKMSMDISEHIGDELAAASEIPERGHEEGMEVNTSHQCGIVVAEDGEECRDREMSDVDSSVGDTSMVKLKVMVLEDEEAH
ncbi:hypothetical protein chiPu_0015024 [Chiloscyllium punctatum]|uniref:Myb/SANT-like DNA-binding domain-containing protein n=1 Tax=Chiloscyllium punctatum TaxID=137246 RepID=A0A401T1L9_CHIPU|nr:hypothetical protein [Chiloscyllium punctatum]